MVKWNPKNRIFYEEKGYVFTKYRDTFDVRIDDLAHGSHEKIECLCDYCGEKIVKSYKTYTSRLKEQIIKKDACNKCQKYKVSDCLIIRYGVDNIRKINGVNEKIKMTTFNTYGVEHNSQSEKIKEKKKTTNLKNFGVDHIFKDPKIRENRKKTFIDKFGADNPMKNKNVQLKAHTTNIIRYGFKSPSQNPEIQAKQRKSLYENNTAPSSKQQRYIHHVIGGEINYPEKNISLDIAFLDEKIYFEYDGGGHGLAVTFGTYTEEEYRKKEQRRFYALMRLGWREIRLKSKKDRLPSKEKLLEIMVYAKKYLIDENRHYIRFDVDENIIKTSQYEKYFDFGDIAII
jgi:hypothetical protein